MEGIQVTIEEVPWEPTLEQIQQIQNQTTLTAEEARQKLIPHRGDVEACLRELWGLPVREKKIPKTTNQAIYSAIRQKMRITRVDPIINTE